jgi:hypothetical protein
VIELDVCLETDPGRETDAQRAAKAAEQRCLISASLDAPVHVELDVRGTARRGDARSVVESHLRWGEADPLPDSQATASCSQ